MSIVISISYFIFGTIIGSFLNVVALRHNTNRTLRGRSHCFSCNKTLSWRELVPVFSYLFSLGRCRSCGSKISLQYPAVELLTGVLFVGVFLKFSSFLETHFLSFIFSNMISLLVMCLLVIILIYDIRHKIIPDTFVYTFIALPFSITSFILFVNITTQQIVTLQMLLPFLAGPILFLPFFLLSFLSRGAWMGYGDGKLALGIGWFLGLHGGFTAILLAFWIGAIVGVLLLLFGRSKKFTMKSAIPFAPFLILGFMVVFFFDILILDFIL